MSWLSTNTWEASSDGNWSTFSLRVGSPPQYFHALPSTRYTALRLPFATDCDPRTELRRDTDDSRHTDPRANLFWLTRSSSWKSKTDCDSGVDVIDDDSEGAKNHEYYPDDYRAPVEASSREDDIIQCPGTARVAAPALIGARPVSSSLHGQMSYWWLNGPAFQASVLQSFPLAQNNGLAYSYTAGAWYKQSRGSFTLAGYDRSFRGNDTVGMPFTKHWDRPLNLDVLSISVTGAPMQNSSDPVRLLSSTVSTMIDTTSPFLELPEAVCQHFQDTFGLQYNSTIDIFLVNATTRARLRALAPNITMHVGSDYGNPMGIDITLPYAAFDHEIEMCDGERLPYFPIRVAKPEKGNILGRVFFQEAHLLVAFNDGVFWISNAAFPSQVPNDPQENMAWAPRYGSKFTWKLPETVDVDYLTIKFGIILWGFCRNFSLYVLIPLAVIHLVLPWSLCIRKLWHFRKREKQLEQQWLRVHMEARR